MLVDLIIDGNYVLSSLTFTLHKNNLLFGSLYKALEVKILNHKKWFGFTNVYLVSDSKDKSWRKSIDNNYKSTRKKDVDIDWDFVYNTYGDFKTDIKNKGVKVLEAPGIEGDDWIAYLVAESNKKGRSTIIISNDYDIKQLLTFSLNPLYINIMSNEMYNKQKLFLPKHYQLFLNGVDKLDNDDIFNINDNNEYIKLLKTFIERYDVHEIDNAECLIIKLIMGDKSDNIPSAWITYKNNLKRGIGATGAKTIFDEYVRQFGDPDLKDPDLLENIADLICEKKKLPISNIPLIKGNIIHNKKLVDLEINNLPPVILNKMKEIYNKYGI